MTAKARRRSFSRTRRSTCLSKPVDLVQPSDVVVYFNCSIQPRRREQGQGTPEKKATLKNQYHPQPSLQQVVWCLMSNRPCIVCLSAGLREKRPLCVVRCRLCMVWLHCGDSNCRPNSLWPISGQTESETDELSASSQLFTTCELAPHSLTSTQLL